jgi:hypothetical protein
MAVIFVHKREFLQRGKLGRARYTTLAKCVANCYLYACRHLGALGRDFECLQEFRFINDNFVINQ